jgi:ribosome-associated protein
VIEITPELSIDESELTFSASRSGGPGGQNVNKVASKVTLEWNVEQSSALTDEQRATIQERLAARINQEGVLKVSSQQTRSQHGNREIAHAKFVDLLRGAFREKPPRKKTRMPKAAKERRLGAKKERSELKKARSVRGEE